MTGLCLSRVCHGLNSIPSELEPNRSRAMLTVGAKRGADRPRKENFLGYPFLGHNFFSTLWILPNSTPTDWVWRELSNGTSGESLGCLEKNSIFPILVSELWSIFSDVWSKMRFFAYNFLSSDSIVFKLYVSTKLFIALLLRLSDTKSDHGKKNWKFS